MPPGPSGTSSPDRGVRRAVARLAALLLVGGGVASWLAFRGDGAPRPDIVLVVWDTCRADRVSACGYALPTTPRLAALASEGVNFRRCFTPAPWTPPAHASLFTGLLPVHHGLRERMGDKVHPDLPFLADTLRRGGYETVAASANPLLGATGLLEGFETVLPVDIPRGLDKGVGEEVAGRVDAWLAERSRRVAERRPIFLFVNLMDAHLPLVPAAEDLIAVHGAEVAAKVPPGGGGVDEIGALSHLIGVQRLTEDELGTLSMLYDAGVHAADRATERILNALRREDLYAAAVVAVAGDHGEMLGEHGDLEHRMSVWDPALHVPLVIRWPGRLEGGRTEDAQVRLQDLYPTLLEAARVTVPPGCGRDAVPLTESPLWPRESVSQLLWIHSYLPGLRDRFPGAPDSAFDRFFLSRLAVREVAGPTPRKWVLVRRFVPPDGSRDESEALFETRSDPGEERNLLGPAARPEDRAAAERLRALFGAMAE